METQINRIEAKLDQFLEESLLKQAQLKAFVEKAEEDKGLANLYFERLMAIYAANGLGMSDLMFCASEWFYQCGSLELDKACQEIASKSP